MERINSTEQENDSAISLARAELGYYDKHPTEVEHIFIPQAALRRLVQMAELRTFQADKLVEACRAIAALGPSITTQEIKDVKQLALDALGFREDDIFP